MSKKTSQADLDKNSQQPIYLQLAALLRARIAEGTWAPGRKIPSEPMLAQKYGLSVLTVRQAVGELVGQGLLAREQGRGTFVRGLEWSGVSFTLRSIIEMVQKKEHLKMRVLSMNMEALSPKTIQWLRLPAGSKAISIKRLFLAAGKPIMMQQSLLKPVPDLPSVESDLCLDAVADFFSVGQNARLKKAELNLEAENVGGPEADYLAEAPGALCYRLSYLFYDFSEQPLGGGWLLIPKSQATFRCELGLWN